MLIQEPPSGVVAVVAWIFVLQSRRTFHFLPIEAWLETSNRVVERFPGGVGVVAQFRPQWLKAYLRGNFPIINKIELAKFCADEQIVVDSPFWARSRFPLQALPEGYQLDTVGEVECKGYALSDLPKIPSTSVAGGFRSISIVERRVGKSRSHLLKA